MEQHCRYITSTANMIKTSTTIPGSTWPGTLISAPFIYKHNNINYDLNLAGVYKFSVPCQNTTNIVINEGDIKSLIKSLTYFIVPGQTDEGKTLVQLNSKSYSSRINVLCNTAANWVKAQLTSLGITSRIVRCLRADTPNNFYDGHVMLEVFIGGEWHWVDTHLGLIYGDWLSLKDVAPVIDPSGFVKIHSYKLYNSPETMYNNVYHHSSTVDMFLADDTAMREFQQGIMQIPGIDHTDGNTYFYLPTAHTARQSWVLSLSSTYRVVSYTTWLSMFY